MRATWRVFQTLRPPENPEAAARSEAKRRRAERRRAETAARPLRTPAGNFNPEALARLLGENATPSSSPRSRRVDPRGTQSRGRREDAARRRARHARLREEDRGGWRRRRLVRSNLRRRRGRGRGVGSHHGHENARVTVAGAATGAIRTRTISTTDDASVASGSSYASRSARSRGSRRAGSSGRRRRSFPRRRSRRRRDSKPSPGSSPDAPPGPKGTAHPVARSKRRARGVASRRGGGRGVHHRQTRPRTSRDGADAWGRVKALEYTTLSYPVGSRISSTPRWRWRRVRTRRRSV